MNIPHTFVATHDPTYGWVGVSAAIMEFGWLGRPLIEVREGAFTSIGADLVWASVSFSSKYYLTWGFCPNRMTI